MSVGDHDLLWPVKSSLGAYVEAMEGSIEVAGGVLAEEGCFRFPAAEADGLRPPRFAGMVRFVAHGGELDYRISNPAVVEDGDALLLEVDGWPSGGRVILARLLDLERDQGSPSNFTASPALTREGVAVFGEFYPPSTRLDALRVTRTA
jgi:hypothetical protein